MTDLAQIIETDRRLESEYGRAGEALAQHRWHWTLDGSNPEPRYDFATYGRMVGKTGQTIGQMVQAYVEAKDNPSLDLQTTLQLQHVKSGDRAIVQAVAEATGTSVVNTRQHHREDVNRVRNTIAERRETEGAAFTPEREEQVVTDMARSIAAERKAAKASREQRRKSTPLSVLVVEGDLEKARLALTKALEDSHALDLGDLDQALLDGLREAIDKITALANLVQTALTGAAPDGIDWDAELAKIGGGA